MATVLVIEDDESLRPEAALAAACVLKPVRADELVRAVASVLPRRAA